MHDISDITGKGLPSTATLFKATAVALLIAGVVLIAAVLPAEYGIDPTGIGARLGLTAMSAPEEENEEKIASVATATTATESSPVPGSEPISALDAVWKRDTPFRSDEMSLVLKPDEGAEIKALMAVGDPMVFSWTAEGGGVNFDMHGEELNAAKDEYTSYWKGRDENSGNGAFEAPFAGTHGWYWRNRGNQTVTVRVRTSGYYEKLFKP
jgi:hypothetical protein